MVSVLILLSGVRLSDAAELRWDENPPEEGVTRYTVYFDSQLGRQSFDTTSTTHPLTNLVPGVEYTIGVTATSPQGESLPATISYSLPVAPKIVAQPEGRTVNSGEALQLAVTASGTAPLAYQWFRNGQPVSGAQSASYAEPSASPGDAGSYFVRVTNPIGTVDSTVVTVNVTEFAPPVITAQPQPLTLSVGEQLSMAVAASGAGTLSYQWYKDGVALAGQTEESLRILSASPTHAGTYKVRVSNAYGSVDSLSAVVTVITEVAVAPTIVSQPASKRAAAGGTVNFEVVATGTAPFAYQWFRNGSPLYGETSSELIIPNIGAELNGSAYKVVVTNAGGSASSGGAILTVLVPPSIARQPSSVTLEHGAALSLSVEANGSNPLTYQWFKNGQAIPGATSSTFSIASVSEGDAGTFTVTVKNEVGSVGSSASVVTITPQGKAPEIVSHPRDVVVGEGKGFSLTVVANGTEPMQYQWMKDGQALSGQTSLVLEVAAAKLSDAGSYSLRILNEHGFASSGSARVTVLSLPEIVAHPRDVTARLGTAFRLEVAASGGGSLQYQWLKDGVEIAAAVEAIYQVSSMQAIHAGRYQVRVSNLAGSVVSEEAVVASAVSPYITRQPSNQTVSEGRELRLSFEADGTRPFLVEWLRNGTVVSSGAETEFLIPAAQKSDAGTYVARVSNTAGAISTSPATVGIVSKPVINKHPVGQSAPIGASVTLLVSASGEGTLSFQWYKDGQPITSGKSIYHTFTVRSDADFGTYTVRVSNSAGTTESLPAAVEKISAPVITIAPKSEEVLEGSYFSLQVAAEGSQPLNYQWYKNGVAMPGATTSMFEIVSARRSDEGEYNVIVSNAAGSDESVPVTVRVVPHIAITQQPADANVAAGREATLTVGASSARPLRYQWFRDGVQLSGETNAVLVIANFSQDDEGRYWAVIRNEFEQVQSEAADLAFIFSPEVPAGLLNISSSPDSIEITGQGLPNATYDVQVTADLNGVWLTIDTVESDSRGQFHVRAPGSKNPIWFVRTVRHE